ncbi:hypothetical protein EW146_g6507 [Bondarzewia mesenterica]|uniref:Actin interacting protein 3 C-terminal domain-containing protein n=1 Tax=Bondarzewia mesenterica TaxID=1095465 RepID=A0A4V6S1E1_9AGAM|nr:hypothetical protein EW146_g6507 [Bondarzewia mesenterica]
MPDKQAQPPSASSSSYPSHPSRHDNRSVSSSLSASSKGERSGRARTNPAVESAVTRLLVSIKQLLESLTKWSNQQASEEEVSDVYVRLGNDFNAAVAAFASYNIEMSELMSVPEDLRGVLEDCLSEEANSKNLDKYLPKVRAIITNLLQGLRGKQTLFRHIVSTHRHRSDASGHSRTDSGRLSRSDRVSRRDTTKSSASTASASTNDTVGEVQSRRSTHASTPSRRKESASYNAAPDGEDAFVGGFSPRVVEATPSPEPSSRSDRPSSQPRRQAPPPDIPPPPVPPPPSTQQSPPVTTQPELDRDTTPVPATRTSQVPANVKRYSLVDKPLPSPSVIVDEPASPETPVDELNGVPERVNSQYPPPPPETPPMDSLKVASSLAALKKSDALERRASKRFSTYNISKMTGTPRDRSGMGSSHPNRRSLAASNALTAGELAVLTEADEESDMPMPRKRDRSTTRSRGPSPLSEVEEELPPVPPLPRTPTPEPPKPEVTKAPPPVTQQPVPSLSSPETPQGPMIVFLQVGREVKKATIEPGLSFSSLRMLFVDRFAYNPGQENFPAIYIRDPSSGVQYELEDMDEVKEKCLLLLNIEPLDQIKQHIDTQISSLSQDLRDLRKAVSENRRASYAMPQPLSDSTPPPPTARPTDRQLQSVARRLSRIVHDDSSNREQPLVPQMTGQSLLQPQMTGASVMSEYSNRVVTDLKTQFDEVQNLRRDLGIMRQLYSEFSKQTKESLGALRSQTQKDTVEGVKDDVLKRYVSPKPQVLKGIMEDVMAVAAELESLKEHIKTIKPMWKKTWEEELQSIVEEQQFLNHQEEFLADLLEDHKAVVEVYGHVEKVISIRGSGAARVLRSRGFKPPPMDEGHGGLSTVMLEIKGAAVDPERRMKAIAANQKHRERELAGRADEFEAELKGFVGGKKLKMTGGAEEAERVRQRRNDVTLKAMFNGGSSGSLASSASPSPPLGDPPADS